MRKNRRKSPIPSLRIPRAATREGPSKHGTRRCRMRTICDFDEIRRGQPGRFCVQRRQFSVRSGCFRRQSEHLRWRRKKLRHRRLFRWGKGWKSALTGAGFYGIFILRKYKFFFFKCCHLLHRPAHIECVGKRRKNFLIFRVLLWAENPTTYMRGIFHYFPKLEIKQAFDGYYR